MSKRGENITKRKDGRWEARYIKGYENGKAVYGYLYGKSYAEAKQKKEDALRSSKELSHSKRTETFNDLLDCFLIQKKYCVKESTYAHYCNLIERHIRAELGMMRLCDLSAYAIERYADEKLSNGKVNSKDGLSPKTVKDLLTLIKSVLKYGITKGLIPSNVISFSSPKVLKKDIEILSKDEQETLEKSTICADNLHFGIYLCLYTGMRIGEVCALQWKDIDLINSTISINKTIPVQIQSDSYVIHNKTTKWSIKHDGEIVKEPCELRHGNYYVIDSDDISFAALVIEYQSLTFSSQAYALNKKTVFIGRSNDMNIVLDLNGNISRKTAAIHTDGNGTHTLEDLSGKTGIYVNGEKTTSCVLSFGDEIFIMGTTMVYFNGMIIIPANVKTTNLDKCTEFDILPPTDAEDVQAYARTPRILKSQETGKVVIDAPTAPQKSKEIPFILTAGPSMTMSLAMLASLGVTVSNAINGGEIGSLITSGVMCVSMLAGALLWPNLLRKYTKRQEEANEKYRQEKYAAYLTSKEREIHSKYERNARVLNETLMPAPDALISFAVEQNRRLWERVPADDDFLSVRLGIGEREFAVEIQAPNKGFVLEDDILVDNAISLANKYRTLGNVPIQISLIDNRVIGVVGDSISVANTIITNIVALHAHDEVKLALIYNPKKCKDLKWAMDLPHIWSNDRRQRYVATSKAERIVIFTIRMYQRYAPYDIRSSCLFVPNCSEYMVLAIEKYGLVKGVKKGIDRYHRCHAPNGGEDYPNTMFNRRNIMLNYLLFLPQLALIALYDWIFFVNEYTAFSANCWWAFSFLHATLLVEFISVYFLRHMKQMPFTKKHPMWLFTIVVGIQFLFAVVFSLVSIIKLKWVIILSALVFVTELLSLGVLLLVQKHREKKEYSEDDYIEDDEEPEKIKPELPPPPKKIKSTAMLLLMKFLADPNNWDVPEDFDEINELTELASRSTQYTYEELSAIESDLKEQTNALKTYIQNNSMNRAKNSVFIIMDLLEAREKKIFEVENK